MCVCSVSFSFVCFCVMSVLLCYVMICYVRFCCVVFCVVWSCYAFCLLRVFECVCLTTFGSRFVMCSVVCVLCVDSTFLFGLVCVALMCSVWCCCLVM